MHRPSPPRRGRRPPGDPLPSLDRAATALWSAFASTRERVTRDRLILHYVPLVRLVARRMTALLPGAVDVEDLVSDGTFGLVDAIDRFDPSKGFAFSTFAVGRIRGSMLDGLRALDWAPRSVRSSARALEAATAQLERHLGRPPTEAEVADRLGVTTDECHRMRARIERATVVPLEDEGLDDVVGPAADDADEERILLAAAVAGLPEREALIVRLHDLVGVSLLEIAGLLGISHSRAFQLHERALRLLREAVEERDDGA